jgi:hypothetical protein
MPTVRRKTLPPSSALKSLAHRQNTTRRNNPEDHNPFSDRRENLEVYNVGLAGHLITIMVASLHILSKISLNILPSDAPLNKGRIDQPINQLLSTDYFNRLDFHNFIVLSTNYVSSLLSATTGLLV